VYGGNKVRTLEVLFGDAKARGCNHIFSTGAYGSNHAAATVLHAPRVGLAPGIVLFPQPVSRAAAENLEVVLSKSAHVVDLVHWSALPFGMRRAARLVAKTGGRAEVMVPGGATPRGGLGYVSAALEVAHQVAAGAMPRPSVVVVGVGSTCTSAGLLVGFHHAARMGIGFVDGSGRPAPPRLVAVRVTPWPVTAAFRIARLAARVSEELATLAGDPSLSLGYGELRAQLTVDGIQLGGGYGRPTDAGLRALDAFRAHPIALDTTYSAKAAAAFFALARRGTDGPILFWSTKSTVPLPALDHAKIDAAPAPMRKFIRRARS
jgi:D-cysteine desulfhydrase